MNSEQFKLISTPKNSEAEIEELHSLKSVYGIDVKAIEEDEQKQLGGKIAQSQCFTCFDHVLNGKDTWVSEHEIYMSDFRASHKRGCEVCSLVYRGLVALDPMIEQENHRIQWRIGIGEIGIADMTRAQMAYIESRLSDRSFWAIKIRRRDVKPTPSGASEVKTELPRRLDSEECFRLIRKWLADCESKHQHTICKREAEAILPARVIDIGTYDEPTLRLCESNGRTGRYMALSHCWGQHRHFVTETKTLADRVVGFGLDDLPWSFRDAITVARRLQISFLWIDALCIVQDDEADWERESARMTEVYSDAYLTLAAASCSESYDRFSKTGRLEFVVPRSIPCQGSNQSEPDVIVYEQMPHEITTAFSHTERIAIVGGPLGRRARALQEDILSRRIISFQQHEIVWECPTERLCECRPANSFTQDSYFSPAPRYKKPLTVSVSNKEKYTTWTDIVEQYSQRLLTIDSDKLPALSGLASKFKSLCPGDYLAGL